MIRMTWLSVDYFVSEKAGQINFKTSYRNIPIRFLEGKYLFYETPSEQCNYLFVCLFLTGQFPQLFKLKNMMSWFNLIFDGFSILTTKKELLVIFPK